MEGTRSPRARRREQFFFRFLSFFFIIFMGTLNRLPPRGSWKEFLPNHNSETFHFDSFFCFRFRKCYGYIKKYNLLPPRIDFKMKPKKGARHKDKKPRSNHT